MDFPASTFLPSKRHWAISALLAGVLFAVCGGSASADVSSGTSAPAAASARTVVLTSAARTVSALRSVAEWEFLFQGAWQSDYTTNNPLSISGDSWDLYNLGYGVDANCAMFRATSKTQYLDRALLYVNNVIATARPSSSFSSSQFKDSYLTWVNHTHPQLGNDGMEYPLFESYLWRYVTTLLRAMKENSAVYDNSGYRAQFDSILAFTERNIWEKWYTRSANSYIYRQNTHMASHWALIATNLYILTNDAARKPQYQSVRDNFNYLGLPNYNRASMGSQLRQSTVNGNAYFWNENWGQTARPGQDVAHGNAVIAYLVEAHDRGIYWTDTDMRKLVATLDKVIWPSAGSYGLYVDGTGAGNGWFNDGFVKLGRYSSSLQARLERHTVGQGPQFYGNAALNAKFLTAPVADTQAPTVPTNLTASAVSSSQSTSRGLAQPTSIPITLYMRMVRKNEGGYTSYIDDAHCVDALLLFPNRAPAMAINARF